MGILDPFQMWREAVTLVESEINALAVRKLESAEFAQAANQFSKVSLGVQHVVERSLAAALRRLELPSRSEVDALTTAVQRIEDKLEQLLPSAVNPAHAPRPPRTRRPAPPAAPASKTAKRTLKPATRRAPKED
ncbi:phasin family protein [Pseudomonas sp. H9]|uniref:phasin family protein n=1 Tax=Pseudomonas sp. H9 TaxID=483968 RepID=UPI001057C680|nr:phasin family protein [Pseudomonas sp. H9]TDF83932.1 hypothetical protein E1573_09295 [Pseudomonas sp. H9]